MGNFLTWSSAPCGDRKKPPKEPQSSVTVSAPSPSFKVKKNVLDNGFAAGERAVSKESMLKSQFGAYAGGKMNNNKKKTVAHLKSKMKKKKKKKKQKWNPYASNAASAEDASDFPAPPERRLVEKPKSDWKALVDQASGRTYYWNQVSNETTWEVPNELLSATGATLMDDPTEKEQSSLQAPAQDEEADVQYVQVKEDEEQDGEEEQEGGAEFATTRHQDIILVERDLTAREDTVLDVADRSNDDAFFKQMKAKKAAEQAQEEEAERRKLANMDEEQKATYLAMKDQVEKHKKQKARMVRLVDSTQVGAQR